MSPQSHDEQPRDTLDGSAWDLAPDSAPTTPWQPQRFAAPTGAGRARMLPPQRSVFDERPSLPMRADEIHPGDLIAGKYRVRAILGRSHGLMVEGFHTEFDQRVVIKILLAGQGDDREIERFRREARTFAKLESEHAARILDVGTEPDGSFYLVRQFLDGSDLGTYVQQNGPLPLVDAVLAVLQVAEAVAETHSHGIIVRELQPSHLFLTQRAGGGPVVKISDFGTAKLMRDAAAPGVGGEFTATAMFGLSPYSSPELVRKARDVDARADVWSLGAILYELVTGRPPFSGEAAFLMLQITREDPTPASHLVPGLPPELDQILGWALARDVDARFKSVHALAHALAPYASAEGQVLVERIAQIAEGGRNKRRGGSVPPPAPSFPSGRPPRAPVTLPPPSMPAQPYPSQRPRDIDESVTDVRVPPPPATPSAPARSLPPPPPGQPVGTTPAQLTDAWAPSAPPISSTPQSLAAPRPAAAPVPAGRRLAVAVIGLSAVLVPVLIVLLLLKRGPAPRATEQATTTATAATQAAAPAETATAAPAEAAAPVETASAAPAETAAPSASAAATADSSATVAPRSNGRAPAPPPPPPPQANAGGANGTLLAVAVGGACAFQVNGASKGTSSSLRLSLKPGSYSVVCRPPTGATKAKSVTVRSGETAMAAFKL
jgi:serine/threonine-protein kinase